jgi:hypothetical protein
MTDTITLPRAVVERLVDPKTCAYIDGEYGTCNHCDVDVDYPVQAEMHATDCPVRLVQEALAAAAKQTEGIG